jgi:hypothetical protein
MTLGVMVGNDYPRDYLVGPVNLPVEPTESKGGVNSDPRSLNVLPSNQRLP